MASSCKTVTCSSSSCCNSACIAAKTAYADMQCRQASDTCETATTCESKTSFKMRHYCEGVAQAKGALIHNDNLYVNLVDNNLDDPALGVGKEPATYAGAFDLQSLIAYMIANP